MREDGVYFFVARCFLRGEFVMRFVSSLTLAGVLLVFTACGGGGSSVARPNSSAVSGAPLGSIATFTNLTTIGSTVDVGTGPGAGDNNPYGLAIAPVTAGLVTAGDLIVCNFNSSATSGAQGRGTTIEDIKPMPGSVPVRLAQDPALAGCDAIALSASGTIWASDYTANNNPIVSTSGVIRTTLSSGPWAGPWGQAYNANYGGKGAFFATNALNGQVIRINTGGTFTFDTILSAMPISITSAAILAPAGLTYDPSTDTLYVVDSASNRIIRIVNATTVPANTYSATGAGFNSSNVSTVYSGAPLAAPISMAQLANGHLVVGNTFSSPSGKNLMVEIDPGSGTLISTIDVDPGAPGAIFGIATTVVNGHQYIYFNDDNDNTVKRLSQ